ncbi:MAG: polysaccharide deacetylase family protein [Rhizobiales bacterium]|nr:polysaccharide deacetylase family protein [Hyphomicrobiales bacterium]
MPADWSLLTKELGLWSKAGRTPRVWLRDDDAVAPSASLDRLLALCERYEVPLVLAVIPEPTGEALARHLRNAALASVAVHGWRHANYAPASEKKQELGRHRPAAEVVAELTRGLSKLSALHGEKVLPMLVPPWNRMDASLVPAIPGAGFRAVSTFADTLTEDQTGDLKVINAHLDIIDWSTRRGGEHARLATQFVDELRKSRQTGGYPVGILTHHIVHDDQAWDFLDQLLEMTALSGPCEWQSGPALLETPRPAKA